MKRAQGSLWMLGIAAVLSACASEGNDQDLHDRETSVAPLPSETAPLAALGMNLGTAKVIANLTLDSREVVFFETEEGDLGEIERGILDDDALPPVEPPGMDSAQRYTFLAHRAPPEALARAQGRLNTARAVSPVGETFTSTAQGTDSVDQVRHGQKGTEGPLDAPSRDFFRSQYCVQTDRFDARWSAMHEYSWKKERLGYMKAGIYSKYSNVTTVSAWLSYIAGTLVKTQIGADLLPNEYIGLRVASTFQGGGNAFAGDVENALVSEDDNDVFDLCINYHF
jgi:hypothetical protein